MRSGRGRGRLRGAAEGQQVCRLGVTDPHSSRTASCTRLTVPSGISAYFCPLTHFWYVHLGHEVEQQPSSLVLSSEWWPRCSLPLEKAEQEERKVLLWLAVKKELSGNKSFKHWKNLHLKVRDSHMLCMFICNSCIEKQLFKWHSTLQTVQFSLFLIFSFLLLFSPLSLHLFSSYAVCFCICVALPLPEVPAIFSENHRSIWHKKSLQNNLLVVLILLSMWGISVWKWLYQIIFLII